MNLKTIIVNVGNALECLKQAQLEMKAEDGDLQMVYFLMAARNGLIKSFNDLDKYMEIKNDRT